MKMFASVLEKTLYLTPLIDRDTSFVCQNQRWRAKTKKQYHGDEIPYFHAGLVQLRPSGKAFIAVEFIYSPIAGQSTY
jgi:hypothetical protein